MIRGRRESQWLVLRRCLAIVRRLQRGPADSKILIAAVRARESPDPYDGAEDTRLRRKFEKDLWRIRHRLCIRVRFDRRVGGYRVEDTGPNGLLCLPDHCLHTVAFLYNTFQPEAPEAQRVRSLRTSLVSYTQARPPLRQCGRTQWRNRRKDSEQDPPQ